jgi:tungstate transport system ATP-binding protein
MVSDTCHAGSGAEAGRLCPLELRDVTFNARHARLLDIGHLVLGSALRTVVMGANGAGKSLLLRLIQGLILPSSGSILWNGAPVESVRNRLGFVAQRPVMLRRSTAANIHFALHDDLTADEKARRVAEALRAARLDQKLDTPARLLSGGEQQRLALARALARRPEVLLLDEPTASLDPASILAVEDMIEAACRQGVKIIFVTHDIGQARRIADEVVFLQQGRLGEHASAETFFTAPRSPAARAYLEGRLFIEEDRL